MLLVMLIFVSTLTLLLLVRAIRVMSHNSLKLRPERLDRAEFVAHGDDAFERAIELVDVCEDVFKALSVPQSVQLLSVAR
jgi:hypothetical protein